VRQLGIHFGDAAAAREAEADAQQRTLPLEERMVAVQQLALARLPSSVDALTTLATGNSAWELRREALRALGSFDSDQIAPRLLASWKDLPPPLRPEAVNLLSSRRPWAHALVDAVANKTISRQDLSETDVRKLLDLRDSELTKKVEVHWGKLRIGTPAELEKQLARLRGQLAELPGDRLAGKAVFEKNCMICHKLHGQGFEVGPDLTGANRRDPEYLLMNILDPNRVVGRDYYTALVETKGGTLTKGLLVEDTPQRVTLKGENAKLTTIARSDIFAFKVEERSLMPDGLPNNMTEQQFRDLVAYLMEDPFLGKGQVAGPFKMALDFKSPIEENLADPLKTEGVHWKPFHLGPTAVIDMGRQGVLGPPTDSTAFVYMEVKSPRTAKTLLELAADDNVKVYLNGKEVFRRTRAQEPARTEVELQEGVNRFVFKIHNIYGPSFLWARLADPERVLVQP
jgi:putative heme-binding domain-containing protein